MSGHEGWGCRWQGNRQKAAENDERQPNYKNLLTTTTIFSSTRRQYRLHPFASWKTESSHSLFTLASRFLHSFPYLALLHKLKDATHIPRRARLPCPYPGSPSSAQQFRPCGRPPRHPETVLLTWHRHGCVIQTREEPRRQEARNKPSPHWQALR